MKKITIIFVAMIMATLSMTSCGQMTYLNGLKGDKNIETVYIGKAMMKMAGAAVDVSTSSAVPKEAVKSVDALEVASTENMNSIPKLKAMVDKIVKEQKMELLLETNEDDENTYIYGVMSEDGNVMNLMLIYAQEKTEADIVIIKGKIDTAKLAQMAQ